jgi:hypothetical protein
MEEKKPTINLDNGSPKTIHTYLSDMTETVRNNEISVIKISAEEQRRKEQEELYKKAEGTSVTKALFMIGGLILIVGSIVGIYLLVNKKEEVVAPIVKKEEAKISADNILNIEYTEDSRIELLGKIKNEIKKIDKEDTINTIVVESKNTEDKPEKLSVKNFLATLNLKPEPSMVRALKDKYEIGFHVYKNKDTTATVSKNLFLLLDISDYNQVYADMLKWEKRIATESYNLFDINIEGENLNILESPFYDIVISNKDARVLYDKEKKGVLYYIFLNKDTLLITQSKESIQAINTRLLFRNSTN